MLVKVNEEPRYEPPLKLDDYIKTLRSTLPIPSEPDIKDFHTENSCDLDEELLLDQKAWVGLVDFRHSGRSGYEMRLGIQSERGTEL